MSYINIHKAEIEHGPGAALAAVADENQLHSFTDGEEITACARILSLLDSLDNGEALVITRELF
jgi:hypothetical protein